MRAEPQGAREGRGGEGSSIPAPPHRRFRIRKVCGRCRQPERNSACFGASRQIVEAPKATAPPLVPSICPPLQSAPPASRDAAGPVAPQIPMSHNKRARLVPSCRPRSQRRHGNMSPVRAIMAKYWEPPQHNLLLASAAAASEHRSRAICSGWEPARTPQWRSSPRRASLSPSFKM